MYLNYSEYRDEYNGKLNENDFKRFERKARVVIDYQTYNRLKNMKNIPAAVKDCIVDLIEYESRLDENDGREIVSETVDTHSITYAASDRRNNSDVAATRRKNIVKEHLIHTGLMYRGC